jgi:hypothetical protein
VNAALCVNTTGEENQMNVSNSLLAAAASGILLGAVACGGSKAEPATPEAAASTTEPATPTAAAPTPEGEHDKAHCKGQNECKGKGGCKTDSHGCKGQNDCKGQGGCKG